MAEYVLSAAWTQRRGELASGGVDGPSLADELKDEEGVKGGVSSAAGRPGEPEALRFPGGYLDLVGVVADDAARSSGRRWGR